MKSGRNLNKKFIEQLCLSGLLHIWKGVRGSCVLLWYEDAHFITQLILHYVPHFSYTRSVALLSFLYTIFYRLRYIFTCYYQWNLRRRRWNLREKKENIAVMWGRCSVGQEWGEFRTCLWNLIENVLLFLGR